MAGGSGGHRGELCVQVAVDALAARIEFTMQAKGWAPVSFHRQADRPDQDREVIDAHHRVGIFDSVFLQPLRLQRVGEGLPGGQAGVLHFRHRLHVVHQFVQQGALIRQVVGATLVRQPDGLRLVVVEAANVGTLMQVAALGTFQQHLLRHKNDVGRRGWLAAELQKDPDQHSRDERFHLDPSTTSIGRRPSVRWIRSSVTPAAQGRRGFPDTSQTG